MKPVRELLAGIPSVVYEFFGLVIAAPVAQKVFHLQVGEMGLSGSFMLPITPLPAVIPPPVFQPTRTIFATLTANLGEAPAGGAHYQRYFIVFNVVKVVNWQFLTIFSKEV